MSKVDRWWEKPPSKAFQGSDEYMIYNGNELLKDRIAMFHGKTNPIRCFTAAEISSMITNCYQQSSPWLHRFDGYEGVLDGRKVLIKHYRIRKQPIRLDQCIRDIAISAEMSGHVNVRKLLGCCLETQFPFLVFEWLQISLYDRIYAEHGNNQRGKLEWKDRLGIAWKIAHVVAYLHNAFPRPIIHRDISPGNVFLDEQQGSIIPKLSNFSFSIFIPEGKKYLEMADRGSIETYWGLDGYDTDDFEDSGYYFVCPDNGRVDTKADVSAFGLLLLELLTGRKLLERGDINLIEWVREREDLIDKQAEAIVLEIIHPEIVNDIASTTEEILQLQHQLQASLKLVLKCTECEAEHRPTMVEIATQLKSMVDHSRSITS